MSILEWVITVVTLFYFYFAIKNKPICFLFGAVGSAMWAYVSLNYYNLLFDSILNAFYVVISFLGFYLWSQNSDEEKSITTLPLPTHLLIILLGTAVSFFLLKISKDITWINKPVLDCFTTVFLVIGTILLVMRKLSSWLYLVIADLFYLYIYGSQQAWLLLFLMVIYIIFGTVGYVQWRKRYSVAVKSA